MPTKAEYNKLIEQAKDKIEKKSWIIQKCNKRIEKFEKKRKNHRKHSAGWEKANKKVIFWRRQKHLSIYLRTHWTSVLKDAVVAKASFGAPLVNWAKQYIGIKEGSALQVKWAHNLGYSAALPWCSIFVANGVQEKYGYDLPTNPAYSGSWMAWKDGVRVAISKRRAGDLCIYDWGDGGITDHVAICEGKNGKRVGGNQENAVTEAPIDAEFIVAVIRPRGT